MKPTEEKITQLAADLAIAYQGYRTAMENAFNATEAATIARHELATRRKELMTENGGETYKAMGSNEAIRNAKLDELTTELRHKVTRAEDDERFLRHELSMKLTRVEEVRAILRLFELALGLWRGQR